MKRIVFLSMLVVFFTISFITVGRSNNQPPTNEDYLLQERCEKQCEKWFLGKYEYGIKDTDGGKKFNYYHNHHNKKLNKCFIITGHVFIPKNGAGIVSKKSLFVVNENKEYGVFSKVIKETNPIECYLSDKSCKSEKEWNTLVKPYMEE